MKVLFKSLLRCALALGLAVGASSAFAKKPAGDGWQRIDNPAPVRGIDGQMHEAKCSGFPGTDPSFSFWARKTNSKNLMVYFEGGGACWDNLTCSNPITGGASPLQFFVPMVPPGTDPSTTDGIFRSDNAANPVRDWNVLYIPYCTGDTHTGRATRTYTSVGNAELGLPPGIPITINHNGYGNFMVALKWAMRHFDDPKKVLVAGVSAGGYGATVNSPWVGRAFPQAHLSVLADSSQGVSTTAFDTGTPGRGSWNAQFAPWVFGPNAASLPGGEVMRRAAQGQRHAKFAQFTPAFDDVQIGFYGLLKAFYGPGGSCPNTAVDWYQQMSSQIVSDAASVGNFRHYVAGIPAGPYHTILRSPLFYTEATAGPSFTSWLGTMLANRGGTNGHGGQWVNAACPTCLVPLPCQ